VNASLAAARELVRAYHEEVHPVAEDELDRMLGLGSESQAVASSYDASVEQVHAGESVVYLATPYPVCRALFRALWLGEGDLVVDLGCGTGRLVLYGSLCTPARFVGVELIADRWAVARAATQRLALERTEVVLGNAVDWDFGAGTVFYLFRPFSSATEATVVARLHAEARRRAITVAAYRLLPGLFDDGVFDLEVMGDLRLYRSAAQTGGR